MQRLIHVYRVITGKSEYADHTFSQSLDSDILLEVNVDICPSKDDGDNPTGVWLFPYVSGRNI